MEPLQSKSELIPSALLLIIISSWLCRKKEIVVSNLTKKVMIALQPIIGKNTLFHRKEPGQRAKPHLPRILERAFSDITK